MEAPYMHVQAAAAGVEHSKVAGRVEASRFENPGSTYTYTKNSFSTVSQNRFGV